MTLTYSNDPATNHTDETTPPDTRVYTHSFRFLKTGADGTTSLEGAVFTLYKGVGFADADKYHRADKPGEDVTATSSADSVVRFDGLAAGEYWVKETGVPAGYRDLDVKFKVVITASNGADAIVRFEKVASVGDALVKPSDDGSTLVVSNVQNLTQLPLTGSGGIALFVAIGGLLAAAGAVAASSHGARRARSGGEFSNEEGGCRMRAGMCAYGAHLPISPTGLRGPPSRPDAGSDPDAAC